MSSIWGDLDGPTPIHLTNNSTTPGEPISKPRIRQLVWDFLEKNNLVNFPRPVHKRIPNFKGAATAAQLLTSLPEFKNANVIKVNLDKPQEEVRYQVLDHKKRLLVPTPRLRNGLFNLLTHPGGDADKEGIRKFASRHGIDKLSKPLPLFDNTHIDVVVVGSVAVDKLGHRIGKGEGFADLEFAMGKAMGAITDDTVVIATVHDCQLFDELPEEIFGEHDISVDLIVTPTIIWRVEKRLPKPCRVIWDILTPEKFKSIPVLKYMKATEEKYGKLSTMNAKEREEETENYDKLRLANRQKAEESRNSNRKNDDRKNNDRKNRRDYDEEKIDRSYRQRGNAGKNRRDYSEERKEDRRDYRDEKPRRDDRNENRNSRQRDGTGRNRRDYSEERVRRDDRRDYDDERIRTNDRNSRRREGAGKNQRDYSEERVKRDDRRDNRRDYREEKPRRDDRNENRNSRQRDGAGKNRREYSGERVSRDDRLNSSNEIKSKERNGSRYDDEYYYSDEDDVKMSRGKGRQQREEEIYDDRPMLYVGKIPRYLRVRELKDAIMEQNVKTTQLVWKGNKGYAFLYFDVNADIEDVFNSLKGLTIGDAVLDVQREKYTD